MTHTGSALKRRKANNAAADGAVPCHNAKLRLALDANRDSLGIEATGQGLRMATGTVKWFNEQKGYGFIAPEGGGNDVFVHISAVERAGLRALKDNQRVSFEMEKDKKSGKMSATDLKAL